MAVLIALVALLVASQAALHAQMLNFPGRLASVETTVLAFDRKLDAAMRR